MTFNVLVIDQHPVIKDGVNACIQSVMAGSMVFFAATFSQAVQALSKRKNFQFIIIDPNLPDCDGVEAIARLRKLYPNMSFVVFSAETSHKVITRFLELGVTGYIPKTLEIYDLKGALRKVAYRVPSPFENIHDAGFLDSTVVGSTLDSVSSQECSSNEKLLSPQKNSVFDERIRPYTLTDRQSDVLNLMLQGCSNKGICRQLQLSEGTIKVHVSAILRALGVKTRTQAVLAAREFASTDFRKSRGNSSFDSDKIVFPLKQRHEGSQDESRFINRLICTNNPIKLKSYSDEFVSRATSFFCSKSSEKRRSSSSLKNALGSHNLVFPNVPLGINKSSQAKSSPETKKQLKQNVSSFLENYSCSDSNNLGDGSFIKNNLSVRNSSSAMSVSSVSGKQKDRTRKARSVPKPLELVGLASKDLKDDWAKVHSSKFKQDPIFQKTESGPHSLCCVQENQADFSGRAFVDPLPRPWVLLGQPLSFGRNEDQCTSSGGLDSQNFTALESPNQNEHFQSKMRSSLSSFDKDEVDFSDVKNEKDPEGSDKTASFSHVIDRKKWNPSQALHAGDTIKLKSSHRDQNVPHRSDGCGFDDLGFSEEGCNFPNGLIQEGNRNGAGSCSVLGETIKGDTLEKNTNSVHLFMRSNESSYGLASAEDGACLDGGHGNSNELRDSVDENDSIPWD